MTAEPEHAAPAPAPPVPASEPAPARRCENCGATLFGEHCFSCGQPTKGLVRHFSSIMGDFFDTVFNIDSRVLRTIWPLLARPGYLSLEYFAGRRVRYVTPMRLFLFLSLVAFFAVQGTIDYGDDDDGNRGGIHVGAPQKDSFESAATVAELDKARDQALAGLAKARKAAGDAPGAGVGIDIAMQQVREKAQRRREHLLAAEKARAAGKPPPQAADDDDDDLNLKFNNRRWDPVKNPLVISWLPRAANQSLNRRIGHAVEVLKSSKSQKPLVDALFNVLPQTLLVMMPLFALMLKLAYLFKRRLYMEHLIVALHSHSFMALAVILIVGLSWLLGVTPGGGFWETALNLLRGLAIAWIPLYLLLMQKRIYGQGWPMTIAKYVVLGFCYTILLGFAMVASIILGLLTL